MQLNLVRDMKGSKKGLCIYIRSEWKTMENGVLLLNGTGNLVTNNMEKAKIINTFFASAFTSNVCLQESEASEGPEIY